ncbi:uncharacterized protein Gasu_62050 [Galdieria sulphuraria]|uniref:Uncharacterized protein n=1 Tax=Galdieria sulphuraria TaxID=130081 RepID=M2X8H0_GALSU|nr:uncharacterized protein Gasu_62050 [Galdieria sulphuraria]EME26147.1 hypothetical protein Gasu_62050 [Galdieria sulphuraria]|eukprot:XP_005702667.1 hypothetical protein Gasu_62050 [Galdieria sulphuraria]
MNGIFVILIANQIPLKYLSLPLLYFLLDPTRLARRILYVENEPIALNRLRLDPPYPCGQFLYSPVLCILSNSRVEYTIYSSLQLAIEQDCSLTNLHRRKGSSSLIASQTELMSLRLENDHFTPLRSFP